MVTLIILARYVAVYENMMVSATESQISLKAVQWTINCSKKKLNCPLFRRVSVRAFTYNYHLITHKMKISRAWKRCMSTSNGVDKWNQSGLANSCRWSLMSSIAFQCVSMQSIWAKKPLAYGWRSMRSVCLSMFSNNCSIQIDVDWRHTLVYRECTQYVGQPIPIEVNWFIEQCIEQTV